MYRLAGHTFTAAAGLSLVLCLAMAALWVRSHWRADYVAYGWVVGTVTDALIIIERIDLGAGWSGRFEYMSGDAGLWDFPRQRLGFGLQRDSLLTIVRIPFWFIVVVTALPPLAWVLKRRRAAAGRGFDVQPSGAGDGR